MHDLFRAVAPALLVLAGTTGLFAQAPATSAEAPIAAPQAPPVAPPTFAAEVEQVIVDLVVVDGKGNPIPDLTKDDLVVSEDGVPQSVLSFEAFRLPEEAAVSAGPPPRVSQNTGTATAQGRTFVILFDDMNLTPHRAHDGKAAVASFLAQGVREGDSVTLIATSGATWWTSRMEAGREELMDTLKRLDGRRMPDTSRERMSDWEAMRIHVYQDPQVVTQVLRRYEKFGVALASRRNMDPRLRGTISDPFVNARAADAYFQSRSRSIRTLEALERALNSLTGARGRKSLILVSEGFIHDATIEEFKRVNAASVRANTAIYFVNARGLEGMPAEFSAEFGAAPVLQDVGYAFATMNRFDDGSESLAEESGGFTVKNTNDLEKGIQRIAREAQAYYLLGYISGNTARDGAFREIEVKFRKGKGKGLKIRARKGYYAPSDSGETVLKGKQGIDPVIQAAIDSPWPEDGIPLRMTHYVGAEGMYDKASVVVVTEVDIRALEFQEVEGRQVAEVGFLLVVTDRESGEFLRYDQAVNLRLRPATRERLSRTWFPIVRDFELPPGDHQAKIVVRETSTGRLGSVMHPFETPSLADFRVTTPILSDTHESRSEGQGVVPRRLARRVFPQDGELICQFTVQGATRGETGMPVVKEGHELRRADGTVIATQPPTAIEPTSLGALARQFGLSLADLAPGDYELAITVRDEVAEKDLVLREPFTVVRAAPSPPEDSASAEPTSSP